MKKGKMYLKGVAALLGFTLTATSMTMSVKAAHETSENKDYHWEIYDGKSYWYEDGKKQGTVDDPQGVIGDNTVRGREICDPEILDAKGNGTWFWLDAVYDGAKAVSKEVWMPYIYQDEKNWDNEKISSVAKESGDMAAQVEKAILANKDGVTDSSVIGKWVRYDVDGKMVKGWYTVEGADAKIYTDQIGNTYYYDFQTGLMAKGTVTIDGKKYTFDNVTGVLTDGTAPNKGSGQDETGKDESGKDEAGKDETGKDETSKDDTGKDDSGKDDTGKDDAGKDDAGKDETGKDETSKDDTGKDDGKKEPADEDTNGISCVLSIGDSEFHEISEYKDGLLNKVYYQWRHALTDHFDVYEYDDNKKLKAVKSYLYKDGSVNRTVTYEYDAKGNLVKTDDSNWEGNISGHLYEYDSDGKLTKETCLYEKEYIANYYNYHYDAKGNCIKKEFVKGNLDVDYIVINDESERYEYDEKGNKVKTIKYDSKNDDHIYQIISYAYDDDGNMIKKQEYDSDETLLQTYEYRADGNPLSWVNHTEQSKASGTYEYDDKGRIKKYTYIYGDGSSNSYNSYTDYECDAVGRPLKSTTYLFYHDKKVRETTYSYQVGTIMEIK